MVSWGIDAVAGEWKASVGVGGYERVSWRMEQEVRSWVWTVRPCGGDGPCELSTRSFGREPAGQGACCLRHPAEAQQSSTERGRITTMTGDGGRGVCILLGRRIDRGRGRN